MAPMAWSWVHTLSKPRDSTSLRFSPITNMSKGPSGKVWGTAIPTLVRFPMTMLMVQLQVQYGVILAGGATDGESGPHVD